MKALLFQKRVVRNKLDNYVFIVFFFMEKKLQLNFSNYCFCHAVSNIKPR